MDINKANIMIVEDEAIVAEDIKVRLEGMGYLATSIVKTGEAALEKAQQDRPDLILMDIRLEGQKDGIETAECIRSRFGIPVIFLTACADEEYLDRAKLVLPFGYMLKPIQDRDLKVAIEIALYKANVDAKCRRAEEALREAEEALRKAHEELEGRVKERTGDLVEANEQLQREIKERRQIEDSLRMGEEKYRLLVNNLPCIVYRGFKDFSVEFFDNKIESLTGYPLAEFNSKKIKWYDLIAEADVKPLRERFIQALKTDKSYVREYRIKVKDKDIRWIQERGQIVCDETGEVEYVSGVFFDVTERKCGEQALYKEKEKFRILVEKSPVGISLIGKDGRYEYVNPKFTELFGYNLKDVPDGREWFKKAYPDPQYRQQVISIWLNALKELEVGQTTPRIFNVRCKDGSEKVINFKVAMMETGSQFIIYEDLTEWKRIEIRLQQAQKMEAMGTLAGGIAHDFNNILSAIMGNAEISLYSLPEQSPVRYCSEQVLKASKRARDLVKQILAFSRQTVNELTPIKVSRIVQEALKLLRASLPTTIEIRQRITTDRDIVLADPTQIHQVVMNLCTNAHHAMCEQGGVLEISLQDLEFGLGNSDLKKIKVDSKSEIRLAPGSYLKLTVSDTGHGMTPEVMERIFDPYFTTKEKSVGTGLGLAVIHGIVSKMGGAVSVDSKPGQGTTFGIFFPLTEIKDTPEFREVEPLPFGNERILFVDDEEFIVDLGKRILERLGYDVVVRTSSIEALKAFEAQPDKFDLIITDMTMPQMTGEKLAQKILQIRPDIPIILCSGFSVKISEETAKEIGIKAFIMKPFVIHEMAKIIRKVLER